MTDVAQTRSTPTTPARVPDAPAAAVPTPAEAARAPAVVDAIEQRRPGAPVTRAPAAQTQTLQQRLAPVRALASAASGGALSTDPKQLREQLNGLYAGAMKELHDLYKEKGLAAHPDIEAQAQKVIDKAVERLTADWKPEEKQALSNVMNTVDQLAGGDHKFNFGDKMAVTQTLLDDKCGILKMAHQAIDEKLPGLGNRIAHRAVDNAYTPTRRFERTGQAGPIQAMRDNRREKIEGIASQEMHKQLNKQLAALGVDPATAHRVDGAMRNLTIDQVMRMEGDMRILQNKVGSLAQGGLGNGGTGAVLGEMRKLLRENVDVTMPPLRNGVPSPRNLDAIIDTALDAAEGLRLRPTPR